MWRNGRRNGLKIRWTERVRAGSSPAIGTKNLSEERLLDLIQKPFFRFEDEERLGVIKYD